MPLTEKQKRYLRSLAHHKKVIVIVGQAGLTDNVVSEIDIALSHHELVKVRINAGDRQTRKTLIEEISQQTQSEIIQTIGHVAVFYRLSDNRKIELPKG